MEDVVVLSVVSILMLVSKNVISWVFLLVLILIFSHFYIYFLFHKCNLIDINTHIGFYSVWANSNLQGDFS